MGSNGKTPAAPQKSGFFREGWRELGRKLERRKLQAKARQQGTERNAALGRLGQRAWQEKIDLSSFADLREHLRQLQSRAEELAATTKKLEQERTALHARRQAESAKFDAQHKAMEDKKQPVDSALHSARERQSNQDRNIKRLVARQAAVAAELASLEQKLAAPSVATAAGQPAQVSVDQTKHQHLLLEQTHVSAELATAKESFGPLEAEVNRLTGESQRYADELAKVEVDRKVALSPIDADLDRVKRESNTASQQTSALEQERTERFKELGLALYGSNSTEPVLAEGIQQIAAIERTGSAIQAALETSLALSRAMPRGTMLKFSATLLLISLLLIGLGYGSYAGWAWWKGRHQIIPTERREEINPYLSHALNHHPAYVVANRLAAAANQQEVAEKMLEAFRAIHLGVYTHDGKQILAGVERGEKDFFLYDFQWQTLARAFYDRDVMTFEDHSQLLGRALLRLEDSVELAPLLARDVVLRYQDAVNKPDDPMSFLILLVDGLARRQWKPYSLSEIENRPQRDLFIDPLQSFLIMLDFFTLPPQKAGGPLALKWLPALSCDVIPHVRADSPCGAIQGDKEQGYWGKGEAGTTFAAEKIAGQVAEHAKRATKEIADKIETGAKVARGVTDVAEALGDLVLLYGITIKIRPQPYVVHLRHDNDVVATFWATVTFEPDGVPEEAIKCGWLAHRRTRTIRRKT